MCITIFADQQELGAYFPLHYRREVEECAKRNNSTFERSAFYLRDFAHGAVVETREMNGYDDSDFYATYYDAQENAFKEVQYASTRGWTYPCSAVIDATPGVFAKWERYNETANAQATAARMARDAATPKIGRVVTVSATRGKAKAFDGQTGVVFWRQEQTSRYGTWSRGWRVGVRFNDGQRCFMQESAVKVVTE